MLKTIDFIGDLKVGWHFSRHTPSHSIRDYQKPLIFDGFHAIPLVWLCPDFICYDKIIVELKAVTALNDEHRAQVQNYLRATGMKLGLLVNFAHYPKLEYERIVL